MTTELQRRGIRDGGPHLSFSQLNTYQDCGLKYKLKYIDRVASEPSGPFIGGIAVHRAIEQSEHEDWWQDAVRFAKPDADAIAYYLHLLRTGIEDAGGIDEVRWAGRGQGETYEWWVKQGEFMLRRYQQTRIAMQESGWVSMPGGTEYRVEAHLPGLSVPIISYLDKWMMTEGSDPVIVDWKTGRIGNAYPMQFSTYASVVEEHSGIKVAKGVAVFLRAADAARRVQKVRFEGLTERSAETYGDLVRGIEAGIFAPNPSAFCAACGVRASCWYWQATQ